MLCFFFFKQKTAYEMRISDWSSDVCSSDLHAPPAGDLQHPLDKILAVVVDRMGSADVERRRTFLVRSAGHAHRQPERPAKLDRRGADAAGAAMDKQRLAFLRVGALAHIHPDGEDRLGQGRSFRPGKTRRRSEEHTSELQ